MKFVLTKIRTLTQHCQLIRYLFCSILFCPFSLHLLHLLKSSIQLWYIKSNEINVHYINYFALLSYYIQLCYIKSNEINFHYINYFALLSYFWLLCNNVLTTCINRTLKFCLIIMCHQRFTQWPTQFESLLSGYVLSDTRWSLDQNWTKIKLFTKLNKLINLKNNSTEK